MDKMLLKGLMIVAGILGIIASIISFFSITILGMQINWLTILINNSSNLSQSDKDAYNTALLVISALTAFVGWLIKEEEKR